MDLHYFSAPTSRAAVRYAIDYEDVQNFSIITGLGKHSSEAPILRFALLKYLNSDLKLPVTTCEDGSLLVRDTPFPQIETEGKQMTMEEFFEEFLAESSTDEELEWACILSTTSHLKAVTVVNNVF